MKHPPLAMRKDKGHRLVLARQFPLGCRQHLNRLISFERIVELVIRLERLHTLNDRVFSFQYIDMKWSFGVLSATPIFPNTPGQFDETGRLAPGRGAKT